MNVKTPAQFDGSLLQCLKRAGLGLDSPEARAFELRWYRGQMRGWAGHWRNRFLDAALLGKEASRIGATALYFAKNYRDLSIEADSALGLLKGGVR